LKIYLKDLSKGLLAFGLSGPWELVRAIASERRTRQFIARRRTRRDTPASIGLTSRSAKRTWTWFVL